MPQALPKLEYELLSRVQRLTRERRTKVVLVAPIQQTEQNREMEHEFDHGYDRFV